MTRLGPRTTTAAPPCGAGVGDERGQGARPMVQAFGEGATGKQLQNHRTGSRAPPGRAQQSRPWGCSGSRRQSPEARPGWGTLPASPHPRPPGSASPGAVTHRYACTPARLGALSPTFCAGERGGDWRRHGVQARRPPSGAARFLLPRMAARGLRSPPRAPGQPSQARCGTDFASRGSCSTP